jgi:group I intron endonuclease
MNIIAGIYQIVNTKNGKSYIGSSKNIKRRFSIHKSALKNNRHHCVHLQRSYNKHGIDTFKFDILKELIEPTEQQLFDEETKHIQELLPEYNIGGVGGGDNLTKNPNREDIVKRITETLRQKVSSMSDIERKETWGRSKEKNPNWKGGASIFHCIDCKCEISYGHSRCNKCCKQGEQNPFHGKKHTDEYKKKSSMRMKGRLPINTNPIVLDGISYISQADAARKLGVSIGSISNWINGKFKRRSRP